MQTTVIPIRLAKKNKMKADASRLNTSLKGNIFDSNESTLNSIPSDNKEKKKINQSYLDVFQTDPCLSFKVGKRRSSYRLNTKQTTYELSDYQSLKDVLNKN